MFYILKLAFGYLDNIGQLEINDNGFLGVFHGVIEKIKENGYFESGKIINKKYSGFDFIIMPYKDQEIFFEVLNAILKIKSTCINKEKYEQNLINNINR